MELGWLETVQFLGLDLMVALILAALAVSALWRLAVGLVQGLSGLMRRRRPGPPTSPRDVYPTEEWGPSH